MVYNIMVKKYGEWKMVKLYRYLILILLDDLLSITNYM